MTCGAVREWLAFALYVWAIIAISIGWLRLTTAIIRRYL